MPARSSQEGKTGAKAVAKPDTKGAPAKKSAAKPASAASAASKSAEKSGPTSAHTGTVVLNRHIRAPPERVYKAFLDPEAMVKWLPPHGFTGKIHHMQAKVGGTCKMSFTNFGTGKSHAFTSKYVALQPGKLIQYVDEFDDPALAGEMGVTIAFAKSMAGTWLTITQRGLPAQIPVEFATMGWQESLAMLEQLVVPEIPDA